MRILRNDSKTVKVVGLKREATIEDSKRVAKAITRILCNDSKAVKVIGLS